MSHVLQNHGSGVLPVCSRLRFEVGAVGVAGNVSFPAHDALDELVFSLSMVHLLNASRFLRERLEPAGEIFGEIDEALDVGLVAEPHPNPFFFKIDVLPVEPLQFRLWAKACKERDGESGNHLWVISQCFLQ